jgi:hypothetical protein
MRDTPPARLFAFLLLIIGVAVVLSQRPQPAGEPVMVDVYVDAAWLAERAAQPASVAWVIRRRARAARHWAELITTR